MTVKPIPFEPTRFRVSSESAPNEPPYVVDLDDDGQARCSCQIVHNRTESRAVCKHIRAVRARLVCCWNCNQPAGTNQNCPICTRLGKIT